MKNLQSFFNQEERTRGNVLSGTGEHNTSFAGTLANTAYFALSLGRVRMQVAGGYKDAAYQVIKENYYTRLQNGSVQSLDYNELVNYLNEKGEELKKRNSVGFMKSLGQSTSKGIQMTRLYQRAFAYYEAYRDLNFKQ